MESQGWPGIFRDGTESWRLSLLLLGLQMLSSPACRAESVRAESVRAKSVRAKSVRADFAGDKRQHGRYYTLANPFGHPAFADWAAACQLARHTVLEPFAGENSLITHLQGMGLARRFAAFDIAPAAAEVRPRDTLADFPAGFDICITNPPWLAKNSATVRGLPFVQTDHDDLYKLALELCLTHCRWVAALVPESFIRSGLFHHRLSDFISLRQRLFADTAHPVGLALFGPPDGQQPPDFRLWSGDQFLGSWQGLSRAWLPAITRRGAEIVFNDPAGNLGLIAFDNVREASIRFCEVGEIAEYAIKQTSRFITRIRAPEAPPIEALNSWLAEFREQTGDVFLSGYRGLRKDGRYRRRMDWQLARRVVSHVT